MLVGHPESPKIVLTHCDPLTGFDALHVIVIALSLGALTCLADCEWLRFSPQILLPPAQPHIPSLKTDPESI
jgi:hypothetical protein